MPKLRILLLNALDIYGGGEFFVYQLAGLLKRKGHKVWVSCRQDNPIFRKCEDAGINVFSVNYPANPRQGKLRKTIRLLKRFIEEHEIDIIHSNTNYDRTAGAFAAMLAGAYHVTNNHSFHSIEHNPTHWFRNKFLTHHFILDGECTRRLLIKKDRINPGLTSVIYLGIEPESMQLDESLRRSVRNEFGLQENDVVIGNVGRMVEMKGQEYLIKAFSAIAEKFPQAKLMIVGDGKLEGNLRNLSRTDIPVCQRVIFPGFRDDLQAIYSAFDIYVQPSVEGGGETFPYAVLYALARGIPVIVTRVGDMEVMVRGDDLRGAERSRRRRGSNPIDETKGVNGFVVPDKNPSAIADKLCELLSDPQLREKMGKTSIEHLRRNFTVEKMADSIENVYYNVLAH